MAELTPTDVETYTQGRLHRDDTETARCLNAALSAARRYCGWHVTPVKENHQLVLDGPGGPLLVLPTLNLGELTSLTEDGDNVDLDEVRWSRRGLVRKKSGGLWTCHFSAIEVTITHGFTEADAADWRSAVLSAVDRISLGTGGAPRVIGPFQYEAEGTPAEQAILDLYRLEKAP